MSQSTYNEPVLLVCMSQDAFNTPVSEKSLSFIEENTFYIPAFITSSEELEAELKKQNLILISVIPRSLIKMQNNIIDEFTIELEKQNLEGEKK